MKYIGLDCHKKYDHATMIDTETGEIKAKRLSLYVVSDSRCSWVVLDGLEPAAAAA